MQWVRPFKYNTQPFPEFCCRVPGGRPNRYCMLAISHLIQRNPLGWWFFRVEAINYLLPSLAGLAARLKAKFLFQDEQNWFVYLLLDPSFRICLWLCLYLYVRDLEDNSKKKKNECLLNNYQLEDNAFFQASLIWPCYSNSLDSALLLLPGDFSFQWFLDKMGTSFWFWKPTKKRNIFYIFSLALDFPEMDWLN